MLIDAERIDRELRAVDKLDDGAIYALGWHEPERLWRVRQQALDDLLRPMPTMTDEQLIAYALEQGRKAKAVES